MSAGRVGSALLLDEVGAGETGAVLVVDDEGQVAEVALVVLVGGGVEVVVGGVEGRLLDGAVLAAQVADFAGLGVLLVAGDLGASLIGVEVSEGLGAVAVLRNSSLVKVVGYEGLATNDALRC